MTKYMPVRGGKTRSPGPSTPPKVEILYFGNLPNSQSQTTFSEEIKIRWVNVLSPETRATLSSSIIVPTRPNLHRW